MGNKCCCCCSSQRQPTERLPYSGLKPHGIDGKFYSAAYRKVRACALFHSIVRVFTGKIHSGLDSNPRYTPDPQRSHVDIIRPRATPTRPPLVKGRVVIAVYNYNARDIMDVSFRKGDRMEVIDDTEGDWLNVLHLTTGEQGLVPGNFVAPELSVESEE